MALDRLLSEGYRVSALVTVLNADEKVSVHGVPRSLLRAQAKSLGFELVEIVQGEGDRYEDVVSTELKKWKSRGVAQVAYGDLFLSDIREWRDRFHEGFGMQCVYPIWNHDTRLLANSFFERGFKAVVTCVDASRLEVSCAGRDYDRSFVADLPEETDPCGENGEFHTFVYDGPLFSERVLFERNEPCIRKFSAPGHQFTFGDCELTEASR